MTDVQAAILYIDDDEGLRRLTQRALERRGYAVTTADGGEAGIAAARATAFDLVAVDHYMPGLDGLQTLVELQKLDPAPPVIYVTGSDESRLAVAALKSGAMDYVVKTADAGYFDLLGQAIDQALATMKLRREHARSEEQLRETNARLQSLLQEVNHRVANSLQLVSALVGMQARLVKDEAAFRALADTERRVVAIAQVHKRLYTSDSVETVEMSEYLGSLVAELGETWSTPVAPRSITLAADKLSLTTDRAVALGVVVNELVTNACKYAYQPDVGGEVRVHLRADTPETYYLVVEDDGCGPPEPGLTQGTGLGSKIVGAMASTLKAKVTYETTEPGLRAVLRAPLH
jgi:two-component sensor histidine kinase